VKIYKASEKEIDDRLALDKRRDVRAFTATSSRMKNFPLDSMICKTKLETDWGKSFGRILTMG